jgi:nicotinate-nucleotide pyrophosphorylase (carboxylating)
LLDTRKSPPGLLPLAKEAFRDGGGVNHRFTLSDQILIKDNHIALVGSVREAVLRGVAHAPPGCAVICEVRSVEEALEAVSAGAKGILVDNQPPKVWESFYRVVPPEVELEFSGGIRYTHLREIPPPPRPIWISSSYPILSAPPLDLSLEL